MQTGLFWEVWAREEVAEQIQKAEQLDGHAYFGKG
jgi:hypothetical protein